MVVPDDHSEPIVFRLSVRTLRVLVGVGLLLALHILAGAFFYYRYYVIHKENVALKAERTRLENENRQIYRIAAKFKELQDLARKLKISLGVEVAEAGEATADIPSYVQNPREIPVSETPASEPPARPYVLAGDEKYRAVREVRTPFHMLYADLPTLLPVEGLVTLGFDTAAASEFSPVARHMGIDIASKRGSIVKAAGSGQIIFAGWSPDLGNLIIIYHGGGIFSVYAHNMRILKQRGYVKKGEPIALLGSSGQTSSGPHLHFEIWQNGVPVDPRRYVYALNQNEARKGS